jgi:2-oxo-4-hydroxy-4-carboxy--5-ureidoimidazoline (OHCU) decarboxylase
MPAELGAKARYCSRAHRQRAYEARQADHVGELRRQLRAARRHITTYERALDYIAADPHCAERVYQALEGEIHVADEQRRAGGAGAKST